jgi:uncharacterized protein (TIGR02466 family)
MIIVNRIFPTLIAADFQPDLADELLPVAEEYLEKYGSSMQDREAHIATYNNKEVPHILNKDSRMSKFTDYITNCALEYLDASNVDATNIKFHPPYYMFAKVGKGSYHPLHAHSGSLVSGLLYLTDCPDGAPIIFKDPRDYYKYISYEPIWGRNRDTYSLFPEYVVKPEKGMLLFFPSWLEHEVPKQNSDKDRVTLVFNLDAVR